MSLWRTAYLLSVLGSQGDAGQFRTPRHIIDFMVAIIDPKKDEVILDPACGTAGFLISSYKHILKANSTNVDCGNGNGADTDAAEATLDSPLRYAGDLLTPEDRQRLASNIKGYDISPDMVRLSLVNLYLHGFADPKVEEYDTLTSDDKWSETADVILANPPFMSPKGGIKPHNRFQVASKRSEVLFVDYMAEHLNKNGRAAIVVPEGIIFQSQNAYCELRKMLVDGKFLVAVISLPAGVFNPYSGVKTSILILDRAAAKASDSIAFFKIENDGFGLGAQRRAVKGSQLPQVKAELGAWLAAMRGGEDRELESSLGLVVGKDRIAKDGQFNLSGERYREGEVRTSIFPLVDIGEVCELIGGSTPSKDNADFWIGGSIKWLTCRNIGDDGRVSGFELITEKAVQESSTRMALTGSTILVTRVSVGKAVWADQNYAINQDLTALLPKDPDLLLPEYLFSISRYLADEIQRNAEGIGVRGVTRRFVAGMKIPLPPLAVQRTIVAEIEEYQKIIGGARTVLENYRPHVLNDPDWPTELLGKVCRFAGGTQPPKDTFISEPRDGYIRLLQIRDYKSDTWKVYIPKAERHKTCEVHDIMIGRYGPPVFQILTGKSGAYNVALIKCIPDLTRLHRMWLYHFLNSASVQEKVISLSGRVRQSGVRPDDLDVLEIPLPPLEIQQAILAEIEAEQALVNANKELITRFEKKIEEAISRVWGATTVSSMDEVA